MCKMGIGAAKVDAVLTTDQFLPGSQVEGRIDIMAGDVEQEVAAIHLKLRTLAKSEGDDVDLTLSHIMDQYTLCEAFTLKPGEERSMEFGFTLHPETPVTVLDIPDNRCKVWLETSLDIEMAMDPKDRDYLHIHPTPVITHFIEAMTQSGFQMVKADVEKGFLHGDGFESISGCYQEMEFKPTGLLGGIRIQEVELSFIPEQDRTHVLVELDRTFGGDGYRSFTLSSQASYGEVAGIISSML